MWPYLANIKCFCHFFHLIILQKFEPKLHFYATGNFKSGQILKNNLASGHNAPCMGLMWVEVGSFEQPFDVLLFGQYKVRQFFPFRESLIERRYRWRRRQRWMAYRSIYRRRLEPRNNFRIFHSNVCCKASTMNPSKTVKERIVNPTGTKAPQLLRCQALS